MKKALIAVVIMAGLLSTTGSYAGVTGTDNRGFFLNYSGPGSTYLYVQGNEQVDLVTGAPSYSYVNFYLSKPTCSLYSNGGTLHIDVDPLTLRATISGAAVSNAGPFSFAFTFLTTKVEDSIPYVAVEPVPGSAPSVNAQANYSRFGRSSGTISSSCGPTAVTNAGTTLSRYITADVS